jgi:hypothetical protein
MAKSGYFAPLVVLPVVIKMSGTYRTRGGELVSINTTSTRNDFNCRGIYENGTPEAWHRSGRILASRETVNDIIGEV